MCSYLSIDIKNGGPGSYNSLHHTHDRKYFSGFSLTWNRREAFTNPLGKGVEEIWKCSCREKGNSILIYEFKYVQT